MDQREKVIVVGAGIGGLATAMELASQGLDVQLFERAQSPGGKMREVGIGGARIDAGPTVLTMRWVFEELFGNAGTSLDAELGLKQADIIARHAWNENERLDLFADLQRSADAVARFSGPDEGKRFLAFSKDAQRIYQTLKRPFISSSRTNPLGLTGRVGRDGLRGMLQIKPYSTLWQALSGHFRDPRLRQLFGRYATYAGSSPFLSPATLMLIAHVEQEGVWLVDGGMHQLAVAMARLAERNGATIHYGAEVAEILTQGGRANAIRLAGANNERVEANAIIVNSDVSALGAGLLGQQVIRAVPPTLRRHRSLSAITWNLVAKTREFPLMRHSVFFSSDYSAEFDDIFKQGRFPQEPTVYICAQDRGASMSEAEAGLSDPLAPERLLILVNAPANGDTHRLDAEETGRLRNRSFAVLERCGLRIEYQEAGIQATTPADFERLFPATGGALYGRASHGWQASFARPGSRTKVPGLYLAGGSTHPGAGVPMAALSGRQAATSVLADLARSRG
ncbi:MAG: 1-hydroxycarotenoid 3,4-desaturase CrtD [Thiohalocapsa sp.]